MTKYLTHFLLDKEKDKPDARLRFRVKWKENIVAFNLGYRVDIAKWCLETQRCKTNTTHGKKKIPASIINREINKFEHAFDEITRQGRELSKDDFKTEFNNLLNKKKEKKPGKKSIDRNNLFLLYDEFIQEEGRNRLWTRETYYKLGQNKKYFYDFKPKAKMSDMNESVMQDFQFYLQDSLKFRNSTVEKQLSFFKWFLRWAKKNKYLINETAIAYRAKLKNTQKTIVFLNQSELKQLREYEVPESQGHLQKIKDIFLFQCFTGLRFSDVINLRNSDVKNTVLTITTIKTSDALRIELNDYSYEILKKYYDESNPEKTIFPNISNQKMNKYLQNLAMAAELNEPVRQTFFMGNKRCETIQPKHEVLSSHAGRRTFICNALALGIPPHIVMKWTGHSDYKAMRPYIDIADEFKADAMTKFNNFI